MNQNARLLSYLEQHGSITRLEAQTELGILNLWQRVRELEKLSVCIRHDPQVEVKDRFGQTCHVTRYVLEDKFAYG